VLAVVKASKRKTKNLKIAKEKPAKRAFIAGFV
jgi:hypothetical protein